MGTITLGTYRKCNRKLNFNFKIIYFLRKIVLHKIIPEIVSKRVHNKDEKKLKFKKYLKVFTKNPFPMKIISRSNQRMCTGTI